MADRDNTIVLGVDTNTRPAITSLRDLKRVTKQMFDDLKGPDYSQTTKDLNRQIKDIEKQLSKAEQKTRDAKAALDEFNRSSGDTAETNAKIAEYSDKISNLEKTLQKQVDKKNAFLSGEEIPTYEINRLNEQLADNAKETERVKEETKKLIKEYESLVDKRLNIGISASSLTPGKATAGSKKIDGKFYNPDQQKALTKIKVTGAQNKNGRFVTADEEKIIAEIDKRLNSIRSKLVDLKDEESEIESKSKQISQTIATIQSDPTQSDAYKNTDRRINDTKENITALKREQEELARVSHSAGTVLENELAQNEQEAAGLNSELVALRDELATVERQAKKSGGIVTRVFKRVAKSWTVLIGMMKRMTIRLLFYQTFGKAIRSTVDYIKQAVKADNELSSSVGTLKGNILTAFQLIYQVLRPIIIAIIKLLTWLTGVFNSLVSLISGKSLSAAKDAAKAMYNLGKSTGGAGKEAKKTLASFDELIQIGDKGTAGGGASADIAPSFDFDEDDAAASGLLDKLKAIAGVLGLIAAIWLACKFSELTWAIWQNLQKILGPLGEIGRYLWDKIVTGAKALWEFLGKIGVGSALQTLAGILLAIGGAIVFVYNYCDAWVNGIDWSNFVGMLVGLTMVAAGLGLAFGPVVAGIGLLAGGIALVVLGIKDMIKQGPTLKNQLTIFAGLIAVVVGLILSGHAALGLVVAIIGAAILIAGNFGEQWSNIMEHCGQIVNGFVKLVKDLINGDFDAAWEDAKEIVKGFANLGIDIFEGLVKAAAKAVNKIIDAINSINVTIPDWVPGVGGKSFTPNLKKISTSWSLPRFAQGAVIPPNKEFMAVLGDQKHGTNIETPLETMIQAFNAALDGRDNTQNININFTGSLAEVARLLKPQIDNETTRQGKRSSNGLIVGGNY